MILDTHKFVENLISAGFKKNQAEVFVNQLNDSSENLATKQDIESVKKEITSVRSELSTLKWMVGLMCAMNVMTFTLLITMKFNM